MTAEKNPLEDAVEQALDAFVYAPIGLLFDGPARFPKLVRNGRSQVTNARMMGQFAVQMGRTELEKRATDLDGPVVDLLRGLGVVPGTPTPTPAPAPAAEAKQEPKPKAEAKQEPKPKAKAATKAGAKPKPTTAKATRPTKAASEKAAAKKAAAARNAATDAATPSADVLPIPDYDSLSASQVVSRLRGLTPGQLDAVRAYESATRSRKTILNRVQQLSKP